LIRCRRNSFSARQEDRGATSATTASAIAANGFILLGQFAKQQQLRTAAYEPYARTMLHTISTLPVLAKDSANPGVMLQQTLNQWDIAEITSKHEGRLALIITSIDHSTCAQEADGDIHIQLTIVQRRTTQRTLQLDISAMRQQTLDQGLVTAGRSDLQRSFPHCIGTVNGQAFLQQHINQRRRQIGLKHQRLSATLN
jgi:hypothetical protein